jgi:hypothetical protein
MARGDPITSPYLAGDWADYTGVNRITVTIKFNPVTRVITEIDTHRDAACLYTRIAVGIGPDGTPDTSPLDWTPPIGDHVSTPAEIAFLANQGVSTIEQFMGFQITAVR